MTKFKVEPPFYKNIIEDTDVCIIGTGAGGAVVAKRLTENGLNILMLEKGGHYDQEYIDHQHSEEKLLKLWKGRGAQMALSKGFAPLLAVTQGQCVGGSTIINYGISFNIPSDSLDIWKEKTGIEFSPNDLQHIVLV